MITITDGKLKMNDVLIDDQDIVQFFAGIKADDGCDLEMIYSEVLIRALKIGISALHRAQTQVDIDTIRREFTQLHGQMGTALERYFGDNGKLNKLLEDVLTGDHSDFALKLDYTEDQSPLKKLYKAFEARMKEIDGRIVEV